MSASKWSALLSLVAAIVIVAASYFQWSDLALDRLQMRSWVRFLLLPVVLGLLVLALVLFFVSD